MREKGYEEPKMDIMTFNFTDVVTASTDEDIWGPVE